MWGASAFVLRHTSPERVSSHGGGILLLHGDHLPYREALIGEALVTVGNAPCPIIGQRSDPRGSFLACGPIPPHDVTGMVLEPIALKLHGHMSQCSDCFISYVDS